MFGLFLLKIQISVFCSLSKSIFLLSLTFKLFEFDFFYKIKLVHLKELKFNANVLQLLLRLSSRYQINMNFCSY